MSHSANAEKGKTHLVFGKVRVRVAKHVQSRLTIGFITSCIHYELEKAAKHVPKGTKRGLNNRMAVHARSQKNIDGPVVQ